MSWYAKPSGAYAIDSNEAKSNMIEIYNTLQPLGFSVQSIAGIIGNAYGESGLNPWRWQNDYVAENDNGYGLYQYTPASGYLDGAKNLQGYSPNYSTTSQTSGATPEDGIAQTLALGNNTLGKWVGYCWRSYWSQTDYPELYNLSTQILNTYGDGNYLTVEQFKSITDLYQSTFAFLSCFEGPSVPNLAPRYEYSQIAYSVISGEEPPPTPPTPPTPTPTTTRKKMPLWFYLRPYF